MHSIDSPGNEQITRETAPSWEAEVLRRIAPRLAEVQRRAEHDEKALGWEAAGVRRLAREANEDERSSDR